MAKKERLKNGLDSLFEDNFNETENEKNSGVTSVRISLIEPDRNQPRSEFDEEKLGELADNIRQHGVLQPILVRPVGDERYQIVAGERRWRASRIAGLSEIPVIIKELSDVEVAQIALIENIQREDLNPIEEAKAYKRLSDEFGMTQEDISKIVGKSRAAVANSVRLLKLEPDVQAALINKDISTGHAKILAGIEDKTKQSILMLQAKNQGLSVRQFEQLVSEMTENNDNNGAGRKKQSKKSTFGSKEDTFLTEAKNAIYGEYGIMPQIKRNSNGSVSMEMRFADDEMFGDFLKRISSK